MLPGITAYDFQGLHIQIFNYTLRLENIKMRIKIVAYFYSAKLFRVEVVFLLVDLAPLDLSMLGHVRIRVTFLLWISPTPTRGPPHNSNLSLNLGNLDMLKASI